MALLATGLSFHIGGRTLLDEASLAAEPGKLVVLLGPNGAGKSTLLRMLAGDLVAQSGQVTLEGRAVSGARLEWLAARRAVMAQSSSVVFDFTVDEVLHMGWAPHEWLGPWEARRARAEVVARCDLDALLGRNFNELSGGEQQRVQFARALLQLWPTIGRHDAQPRYLLLDEPTASLDLQHQLMLMGVVRELKDETALGVVAVLHDLNLAARFADRVVLLRNGLVTAVGTPEEVLTPALLSAVYDVPVHVERVSALDRLVVTT